MEIADILKQVEGGSVPSFVPPPSVRKAATEALESDAEGLGFASPSAFRLAEHLEAGKPVSKDEALELGRLARKARDQGKGLLFKLMGGDPVLKWTRGLEGGTESSPFDLRASIAKVDEALGIVFGWAITSTVDGTPYYDVQDDHIPEEAMLKAAVDFMANSRVLGDNHAGDEGGSIVFAFPLTGEIAKAFGISTSTTGLMIGVKPLSKDTLSKFADGTYTGFSIGGARIRDEVVDHG
jgi:hypothetical protein